MQIEGFIKTSLLDFPGKVASTIFTKGCNFNCPYCHNPSLISGPCSDSYNLHAILKQLDKRKNLLDGVCITGGEATLQDKLLPFIRQIRSLGIKVKLDTNGYKPGTLGTILQEDLVDYIAMDVKNSPHKYAKTCGLKALDYDRIQESIDLIISSGIPHEFRTTVIKDFHDFDDMMLISEHIEGCQDFYLQQYAFRREQRNKFTAYEPETLKKWQVKLAPRFNHIGLRGI